MGKKASFVLYTDYLARLEKMNMEQRGTLFTALLCYVAGVDIPQMDDRTDMAFDFIKSQVDRDMQSYEKTIEAKRRAGKLGGLAKQANATCVVADVSTVKQSLSNVADNVTVNVNDTVTEKDRESKKRTKFVPPTLENVSGYCREKGYSIDAERFINFYESKGWMVGKNNMRDWKAAVRNWAKEDKKPKSIQQKKNSFNNFEQRQYDYDELEKQLLNSQPIGGTHDG